MNKITHKATIIDVDKNTITLELIKTEACKSCAIKDVCQQKKNMSTEVDNPQDFLKGQKVNVFIAEKQAILAIFLGYVLPLILVLSTLFFGLYFIDNEAIAAITSLIILPLYYLVIHCFDKKMKKVLSVRIEQP